MAGRIPPEFIDALLARTDIVDLINSRVPLRKAGKDYQACCPFHDEKTPSFTVSREKQFYHCFGCGAHGTAIGFLMEYEHQGFLDAVEELARQAGMEIPKSTASERRGPDLQPLYRLMEQAAKLYRGQLRSHPRATDAVSYLKSRGLTGGIAASFGLGYAPPGWDFLLGALGEKAGDRELMIQCGLVVKQDEKRYDRFRERIMFPIRDRRGRVIAFGGRILGDGKPKYLNSPETPIFHKGRELYGLHEVLQANRKLARTLVVEGYMDVIALAQYDIRYAVATLGTATTADHLRRLLPTAPELVFCFDGDRAGRAAAWKALETTLPLATGRHQIRFLFLPEGDDPDTLVRKEGKESFEQRIQRASPLSDFLFDHLCGEVDMSSLDGRARLAAIAQPLLEQIPAGLFRDMLDARLAALVGVSRPRSRKANVRGLGASQRTMVRTTAIGRALALLLRNPELAAVAHEVADDWRRLDNPGTRILIQLLEIIQAYPNISSAALLERWREDTYYPRLLQLSAAPFLAEIPADGMKAEFSGALHKLNRDVRRSEELSALSRKSISELNEDERKMLEEWAAAARTRTR